MIDIDDYFVREAGHRPGYLGQLEDGFQLALTKHFAGGGDADCVFTHTLDWPDGGSVEGELDLRGREDAYLGGVKLWGQRVIEFRPGSGAISAHVAIRARELVVFDDPPSRPGEGGGPDRAQRVRASWWLAKHRLGFEALVVYADIAAPPDDLGRFDTAIMAGVLSQTMHPYLVLRNAAAVTKETIIVTEPLEAHDRLAKSASEQPWAMFVPPEKAGGTARWRLSIAAVQQILSSVGFTQQCLTFHSPMCGRTAVPYYTVVAGRAAKPGTAFAVSASRESPAALVERPAAPPPPPPPAPAPARIDHAPLASKLPPLASDDALDRVDDTLPLPSARGRFLVAGTDDVEVFVTLGRAGFKALIAALQRAGVDIGGLGRVLDFGCGVGRVLRYWHGVPGVAIHGTDLNAEAIAWGQDNLRFASLTTNTLEPRLDYPNGHFGFVYALSVFTHLPEAMQRPFLTELLRVIRPGGHLYFTTHGVSYRTMLTPEMRDGFDRDELVVGGADDPGSNYCGAFHPTAYVRAQMLDPCGATLVEFLPEGALGNPTQDSWLIRKPF